MPVAPGSPTDRCTGSARPLAVPTGAEHVPVRADEDSPTFLPPAFEVSASMWSDLDRTLDAFRTGDGVPWGDHDGALYCFTGFDTHEGSVDAARANADAAGLSDRVHFQRADAKS